MTLALGLMSGTSCDGISAALAEFRGRTFRLVGARTVPYPPPLPDVLRRSREWTAPVASQLNVVLGEQFALAALTLLRATHTPASAVAVIGSHGHTVYHGPADAIPSTLQLGEPAIIAERTGLPVVADFRMQDLAAGGSGAPLVPAFDQHAFGIGAPVALQNIGGIANVTLVGRAVAPLAFDTGPGNCLIDAVARLMSHGRLAYDRDGRLASRGRIDQAIVKGLWADPYFRQPPPKSTGPERFNETWLDARLGRRWRARLGETLATLTFFTAFSIAEGCRRYVPTMPRRVLVSGGGALNQTLMRHLTDLLHPIPVRSIAEFGLPVQAKEPVAFAWMALRALRGQANHLPQTTGAHHARILGTIVSAARRNLVNRNAFRNRSRLT